MQIYTSGIGLVIVWQSACSRVGLFQTMPYDRLLLSNSWFFCDIYYEKAPLYDVNWEITFRFHSQLLRATEARDGVRQLENWDVSCHSRYKPLISAMLLDAMLR